MLKFYMKENLPEFKHHQPLCGKTESPQKQNHIKKMKKISDLVTFAQ